MEKYECFGGFIEMFSLILLMVSHIFSTICVKILRIKTHEIEI